MEGPDTRKQLLDFLDREVFQPALRATCDRHRRQLLAEVQRKVSRTRHRYLFDYATASAVIAQFKQDLASQPGQELAHKLAWLELPTFEGVKGEFLALASDLGVC